MFIVKSYPVAVAFCVVTMFCWGSWANTQKLVGKQWRFELFYWDYTFGVLLAALFFASTLGSWGDSGRGFLADLRQANPANIGLALLGGVIFNAANILLVAAIAIAGMAVAFPVGIGVALVLGVLVNYIAEPIGNPAVLFLGVAFIVAAVLLDALAYRKIPNQGGKRNYKGLVLAVLCGVLMGCFYRFVAMAMSSPDQFAQMPAGKLGPYTAVVFLAVGIFLSNFVLNTAIMLRPFSGPPVPFADYFRGTARDHLWGVLGGMIWTVGMVLSIVAAEKAGYAISYGLGAQGGTMVAGVWGVFVWREFREAPRGIAWLLGPMFASYFVGLILVVLAKVV
jgi:glucose uptake protein